MRPVMEIGVKQAAELLKVADKTIYRWVSSRQIPFYRVGAQYRFSRSELLQWAKTDRAEAVTEAVSTEPPRAVSLVSGLKAGGIFYRVGGEDVRSVLEEIVGMMKLPEGVDLIRVVDLLCEREKVATTGLGAGMAFPHCRDISLPGLSFPVVALAFLEKPVDFGSIDGKPVHTVFTLLSPTSRSSIRLMSRLAYAVRKPDFAQLLKEVAHRDPIFEVAAAVDAELDDPSF